MKEDLNEVENPDLYQKVLLEEDLKFYKRTTWFLLVINFIGISLLIADHLVEILLLWKKLIS